MFDSMQVPIIPTVMVYTQHYYVPHTKVQHTVWRDKYSRNYTVEVEASMRDGTEVWDWNR